jgi:hypothetical protein
LGKYNSPERGKKMSKRNMAKGREELKPGAFAPWWLLPEEAS